MHNVYVPEDAGCCNVTVKSYRLIAGKEFYTWGRQLK